MNLTYWIPFFIIVIGNIGYHLVAKATPSAAPAFPSPQCYLSGQLPLVCRCLRGDRAFAAAGSAYIELGKRCLGTDAGGCRIWLYPAIPDWMENQYGLAPGQCQRGAPPGRYRRPVL